MSDITLETFAVEVEERIKGILGDGYDTEVRTVSKNNGIILTGISICRTGERISPVFYLNDYYSQKADMEIDAGDIAGKIADCLHSHGDLPVAAQISVSCLHDFEQVKDKVLFKLINTRSNERLLRQIPSIPYLDLSIVFYLYMSEDDEAMMTAQIRNEHLALWEVDAQTLYRNALDNMQRSMPAVIKSMKEIMDGLRKACEEEWGGEEQDEETQDGEEMEDTPFYVLSTASGINGAACMLYPGLIAGFAEQRGSDIIILPSSLHEVLLMEDTGGMDCGALTELVKCINATEVPPEDILSGNIYRYERTCNKVTIVA